MKIEKIYAPESMDGSEGLLAIVLRNYLTREEAAHPVPEKMSNPYFITDPALPQQVAVIRYGEGAEVPAHVHLPQTRTVRQTQEVIVVRKGVIRLTVYTSSGEWVASQVLSRGEVAVLIAGGHGLTALTEAEILEVKQGPYNGKERDKVQISVPEVKV